TQSLKRTSEDGYPLRAPFSGAVVQVLHNEGEYVEQGVGEGKTIVRIDDLEQLEVDSSVPEMEIGKLKIGQDAEIKATANVDHSYKGVIESISLAAQEQKDWEKSRVEFPIKIKVLNQDKQLHSGMSVIIDVVARKLPQVLTLGNEYVQKDGDHYFVI